VVPEAAVPPSLASATVLAGALWAFRSFGDFGIVRIRASKLDGCREGSFRAAPVDKRLPIGLASVQIEYYDSNMTSEALPLAGVDLNYLELGSGEDVIVDRPTAGRAWDIPSAVALEGGKLVFRYIPARRKSGRRYLKKAKAHPDGRLLTRFIELADASDDKILAYARRYGRIGLCQHGELQHLADDYPECMQKGLGGKFIEPVERWRETAKGARALLNAIAQFSKSSEVSDQTLIALNPKLVLSAASLRKARIKGWAFIAAWTRIWLRACRVVPVILYDPRSRRLHFRLQGRPGLGSALAMQLLTLAGQSKGIAVCSSCARLFSPKRRPSPGRESYCTDCGLQAAWRHAQRRCRQKAQRRVMRGRTGNQSSSRRVRQ
jgi:hypothetical protein